MSSAALNDLFNLYRFTSGRRELAMRQLVKLAREIGWTDLAEGCEVAIEHEKEFRMLKMSYIAQKHQRVDPRVQALDAKVDRTAGAIYRMANEAALSLPPPECDEAQALVSALFPTGVSATTSLPYPEQVSQVAIILEQLETGGRFAATVQSLGLTRFVKQLRALHDEFSKEVEKLPNSTITAHDIRFADATGQSHLLQIVAHIVGRHASSSEQDVATRSKLLAPVLRQNDLIGAAYRARRGVNDVDPLTGDELTPTDDELQAQELEPAVV